MKKIVVFAGTTEGRILSGAFSKNGIEHIVCVATDYGRDILPESKYVTVHAGRMDMDMIRAFLDENAAIVIDATHPYATCVSENIREAAGELNIEYIRVLRSDEGADGYSNVSFVDDVPQLKALIEKVDGNILLTTGSKDLPEIMSDVKCKERIFARIIPSAESIGLCSASGVLPGNIIAMQGPFSANMNEAIIHEHDIKCIVTKASGKAGGFLEKLEAATRCNIGVIVIGRPVKENGVSLSSVLARFDIDYSDFTDEADDAKDREVSISLIGAGMGNPDNMTVEARRLIADAQLVFAPKRLSMSQHLDGVLEYYRASDIIPQIAQSHKNKVAVLFSGDSGFYSGAKSFLSEVKCFSKQYNLSISCTVIPGVSAVSYLAARLMVSYDDAFIGSIHGVDIENDIEMKDRLISNIMTHEKSFILLSGDKDIRLLAGILMKLPAYEELELTIADKLSYADETIMRLDLGKALTFEKSGLYIAYIFNPNASMNAYVSAKRRMPKTFSDGDFLRNKTPMTKELVRHEAVRLLGLCAGDVVYDVGSGTGSVSIEASFIDDTIKVYAIEKNQDAARIMRENIERFGADNIIQIDGEASEAIKELEAPDAVFVGGSSGRLADILREIEKKKKGVRFVITAVSLETVGELIKLKDDSLVTDYDIKLIQVSNVNSIGSHNLLKAENPVYICSFIR